MAFLDATVVNVALPQIGGDLGTDVAGLQWVLNGYLLTTSALILIGGSLGDTFGRRSVFLTGVVVFAVASAACGVAPNAGLLVLGRVAQGVGGGLLTPGSLAIIEASFARGDRSRAIGAWSGLTGVAAAIGPFVGGSLVDAGSWRWVFLLNVPLAAVVVMVTLRHVPETRNPEAAREVDVVGAVLVGASLAALSWGLIAAGERGWSDPAVALSLVASGCGLALFAMAELRGRHPMLPPGIFAAAQFRAANLVTVAVYAGLGVVFFLLVLQLQQVLGYSAVNAGAATLPITALMLLLSSRSGQLADRIGPRVQLTVGPLMVALGFLLMSRIDAGDTYLIDVLPPVLLVGLGLATTVAPLTATALAAVDDRHAGVASGVNNTLARASQLAAVAAVPVLAGITGEVFLDPDRFSDGFSNAMLIAAGIVACGGLTGFVAVRNPAPDEATPPRAAAVVGRVHCGVEGPAIDQCPGQAA
jgi:EmrB/QacA subfamily drug resistance transporter